MKYINENGRSMVEMLGVLAIIGVLSVGGIAGYSKAMNKYKINKTTDQVSMLVANIRTLFSSQGNYEGLNNAQAIKFGVVPEDMIKDGSDGAQTLSNAFGGEVKIGASGGRGSGDNEAFSIVYSGLSSEACVTLATGDWGSGQASGLIAISAGINGNTSGVTGTGDSATGKGVDAVYLGTSGDKSVKCDGTGTGSTSCTAIAVPGADKNPTPMSVTNAVNACSCTSTTCEVAWKYY